MTRTLLKRTRQAAALLAACGALALGSAAQAGPVATYSFDAGGFFGGGALAGGFTVNLQPTTAPGAPFALPSGLAQLADVLDFAATFSGNARLPDASFDITELQSLRLLDNGTFAGAAQTVQSVPAILEILAFDDETDVSLRFLFAASDALLQAFQPFATPGLGRGAEINDTADDTGRRFTDQAGVELIGATFDDTPVPPPPPQGVPEPGSAALAGAALLAAATVRRRRPA